MIWEDELDDSDEMQLSLPRTDSIEYYLIFGVVVHWETLIEYLETVSLDPVVNNDILYLKEFYFVLDNVIDNNFILKNKDCNLMLLDFVVDNDSLLIKNKMKLLNSLDSNVIEPIIKKKSKKYDTKLKKRFIQLNEKVLSKNEKLKINYEFRVHNQVLVGSYLNQGLYPISDYDSDRVALLEDYQFHFSEYSLFNYSYHNDLKWLDLSLIEYKTKI